MTARRQNPSEAFLPAFEHRRIMALDQADVFFQEQMQAITAAHQLIAILQSHGWGLPGSLFLPSHMQEGHSSVLHAYEVQQFDDAHVALSRYPYCLYTVQVLSCNDRMCLFLGSVSFLNNINFPSLPTFFLLASFYVGSFNMLQNNGSIVWMIDALQSRFQKEGWILLRLKVRPQAAVSRFRGPLGDGTFKVDIAATPEDGMANTELVRFLAETFRTSRSSVEFLAGQTSRLKTVIVRRKD